MKLYTIITQRLKSELTICVKDEVDVLGSPSPISLVVSVDFTQH